MPINSEKERLLCYATGIFQAKLSNQITTQFQSDDSLMRQSIREANKMIDLIYNDDLLNEVLKP